MPKKKRILTFQRLSNDDPNGSASKYQSVWIFALFDLPVNTKQSRRQYTQFRKALIKEGFSMLQYSVYARYCPSEEASTAHRNHVHSVLPPDGQVRLLSVTDVQFGKMEVFFGKKREKVEDAPLQLMLF